MGTWCPLGCASAAFSYQPKRTLFSVLLGGQGKPRAKACLSRCTSSWTGSTLLSTHQDGPVEESQSALRAARRGCGPEMSVRSSIWLCLRASPQLSFQGVGRGQSRTGEEGGAVAPHLIDGPLGNCRGRDARHSRQELAVLFPAHGEGTVGVRRQG